MPVSHRESSDGHRLDCPADRDEKTAPSHGLRVAVLGSTGSIGTSTLDVIAASEGRLVPHLLAAHTSIALVLEQARRLRPRWVVVTDPAAAGEIGPGALPEGTRLAVGPEALDELVAGPEVDRVVSAIVGAAGLRSTWAAIEAGKTVALANKETLVMAGPLVMRRAAETGARIIPVHAKFSRCLRMKTWDGFIIPLPFSEVSVTIDDALQIPGELTGEEFEEKRKNLEDILKHAAD